MNRARYAGNHPGPTSAAAVQGRWSGGHVRIVVALIVGALVLQMYVLLHEGGHAIAGMAFGGTLTSLEVAFWDFGAHVGFRESFSGWRRSLISVAGTAMPLLAWLAFILVMPRRTGAVAGWLKLVASAGTLNTLLPWIVIPLAGRRPPGDDVTHFLENAGLVPWSVAAVVSIAYVSGWILFLLRIPGVRPFISSLAQSPVGGGERRWMVAITAVALASVAVGAGMSARAERWIPDVPAELEQVVTVSLGERARTVEAIHALTVREAGEVRVFALLKDVDEGPLSLELHGPGGFVHTLFRGNNEFRAGRATVDSGYLMLAPGEYRVVLSSPKGHGTVSVWSGWKRSS